MKRLKKHRQRLERYESITGMSEILRRTFVNNGFDGALTMLGVLLGGFVAGISEPSIILKLGLATSIAVAISGWTGAIFAESAERRRELKEMEKALHRSLEGTSIKEAHDFAAILTALVDGFSPLLTAMLILSPFFLVPADGIVLAYECSAMIALAVFFMIGAFLGKVSGDSMLMTGFKLLLAGIFCMLLILLLGL